VLRARISTLERAQVLLDEYEKRYHTLLTVTEQMIEQPTRIPAEIRQYPPLSPPDSAILQGGSLDGFRESMVVFSPQNDAIGILSHVSTHTSILRAFSSAGMETEAILYASTSIPIRIIGKGAGTLRADIPRDIPASVGDVVYLQDMTRFSPIGSIVHIDVVREDAYQRLYIRPLTNIYHTGHVLIDPTVTHTSFTATSSSPQ
jgi:hypothetical protein